MKVVHFNKTLMLKEREQLLLHLSHHGKNEINPQYCKIILNRNAWKLEWLERFGDYFNVLLIAVRRTYVVSSGLDDENVW